MPAADILSKLPAGFGNMMTSIGLLIVFGSIFGDFLGNSGATEELAKGMVRLFGKKNDYLALNLVGFILSIPIYFGCAYIMTAPLVTALQKISKKSMKGYVIAIFTGLMLTHSCVAPTPGPLPSQARLARTSAGSSSGASSSACRQPPRGLGVCEPRQLEGRKAARPRRDEGDRGGRRPPRSRPHQALRAESLPARHVPHRPHRFRSHLLAVRHGGPVYTVINFVGNSNIASSSPCSSLAMFCIRICLKRPSCSTSTPMQTAPAMSCSSWVPVDASPPCWGQRP